MQQELISTYLNERLTQVSKKLEELYKEEADLESQVMQELEDEEYQQLANVYTSQISNTSYTIVPLRRKLLEGIIFFCPLARAGHWFPMLGRQGCQ